MTEDTLSTIATWIYIPSIWAFLFIIFGSFFLKIWLPSLHGKKRVLAWFTTTLLTLIVFIVTLILTFSMGGCFENCTGRKDDEISTIAGGIVNWVYVLLLFFRCTRKNKKMYNET